MKLNRPKAQRMLVTLAVLFFITGLLAVVLPVIQWDRQIETELEEYDIFREAIQEKSGKEALPSEQETLPELKAEQETGTMISATPECTRRTVNWQNCHQINQDIVAWIAIPGTPIDYPVVQTNDPDYYLSHTVSGRESAVGTLFSLDDAEYQPRGRNIAIYGHHLRAKEKMFTPLMQYKDPAFYAEHKIIHLDTPAETGTYTIFAVINMSIGDWNPSKTDFPNDEAFANYIARAKRCALYDTGVEVLPDDHVVTLITCDRSYGGKDGRLIVMAVRRDTP